MRFFIRPIVALSVVLMIAATWVTEGDFELDLLRLYSVVAFAVVTLFALWDRVVWHLKYVQRLRFVPPDLRGTWAGELRSQWIAPDGTGVPAKTVFLVVRQTFSATHVSLHTDESTSHSTLAVARRSDHSGTLDYMFINTPGLAHDSRSRMHHGSTSLTVSGSPATRLRGRYWTDRDSKGELDFTRRVKKIADDYRDADHIIRTG